MNYFLKLSSKPINISLKCVFGIFEIFRGNNRSHIHILVNTVNSSSGANAVHSSKSFLGGL